MNPTTTKRVFRTFITSAGLLGACALLGACEDELPTADGGIASDGSVPAQDSGPPVSPVPDLVLASVTLTPARPVAGQPVKVVVELRNDGGAAPTVNVPVEWRGGEAFPSPSCSWSVGSTFLGPGAELFLACDFTYASWYGSITHVASVDPQNAVNEGSATAKANNTLKAAISVAQ